MIRPTKVHGYVRIDVGEGTYVERETKTGRYTSAVAMYEGKRYQVDGFRDLGEGEFGPFRKRDGVSPLSIHVNGGKLPGYLAPTGYPLRFIPS